MANFELILRRTHELISDFISWRDLPDKVYQRIYHNLGGSRLAQALTNMEDRLRIPKEEVLRLSDGEYFDLVMKTINDNIFSEKAAGSTAEAQVSSTPVNPGGINFDPSLLNLQIKRDDKGVPLPLPQQDIQNINIKGLYPIIINIQPILNIPAFLGMNANEDPVIEVSKS